MTGGIRLVEFDLKHSRKVENKLKTTILNRFYDINKRKNRDYTEFMGNLSKPQFGGFTNGVVVYHMLLMEGVMEMQLEVAENPNFRPILRNEKTENPCYE